jgi:hypothetical protein
MLTLRRCINTGQVIGSWEHVLEVCRWYTWVSLAPLCVVVSTVHSLSLAMHPLTYISRVQKDFSLTLYSGTSVYERLSSRKNRFTNKFSEQKPSRMTNGVSSNEHASQQQRLSTSWEYRRESVSCCVTFAQYTSLLEFALLSLEFPCVLWFLYIIK